MSITEGSIGTVKYYDNNGNEMSIDEIIDYCFAEEEPVKTENVPNIIRILMNIGSNRHNMIIALAEAGYKVWIEEDAMWPSGTDYYVCFEV